MKIKNHDDFPKLDHRSAPSFWVERDWVIDSPPIPRARPGDGGTINWGIFKRHFWGELLRHQHQASFVLEGAHQACPHVFFRLAPRLQCRLPALALGAVLRQVAKHRSASFDFSAAWFSKWPFLVSRLKSAGAWPLIACRCCARKSMNSPDHRRSKRRLLNPVETHRHQS